MNCPNCGNAAAPGDRFCRRCGHALARTCSNCSHALGDDDRFCPNCGTDQEAATGDQPSASAVPAVGAPTASERRLVSVLFADLVGFTPYSESRDPEEIREMLTAYFDRCRSIIEQFGGTVDKFIGDAVMAVWGATQAREDDAELAVRAALDLVDMVTGLGEASGAPDLALRAGVLSGESSVGPGGNAMGLVVGDMVNTASRLQSIAEPRTVLVGQSTVDLTRAAINYVDAGVHEVKGKIEPVTAYRATGLAARLGGRERSDLIEPPFTGRDHELRMLKDRFSATRTESRARLVSIVGEAGIGKTRLAWELKKHADGLVDDTYWHEGRSPSYGDGLTLWALTEMVRMRCGIAESDDDHRARTKLRTAVLEHVPDPEEQRWLEPRLAGLLGLDEMPPDDRSEFFAALRAFFQRLAEDAPVVMVFEDLHWADEGLLDFIEDLVDRAARSPILVLTLSRPELLERRPGFGSTRRNQLAAHLAPLSDEAMATLISGVAPDMPEDLRDGIVERAAGVPLYAVEFIRMYLDSGGDTDLAIPDSLRAVIGARIDRLEPKIRSVIQDASVLGVSFYAETLAALRGVPPEDVVPTLETLTRQEILEIEDDPRSPERGQYVFVQGLIREVAYARLAREERRQRHLAAARQLEIGGDPEVAAAIAAHYLAAHDAGSGSDDDLVLARRALLDAARRADALHSHQQVVSMADRALAIEGGAADEDYELNMLAMRASSAVFDIERARAYGEAALTIAERDGDRERRVAASQALGKALNDNYRADEAIAVMGPVFDILDELDTPAEVALAAEYARSFIFAAQFDKIVPIVDRALARAEHLGLVDSVAHGLATKAAGLGYGGRIIEAIALTEAALDLAERNEMPSIASRAANNLSVMLGAENLNRNREVLERALPIAKRSGDPDSIIRIKNLLTNSYIGFSMLDEAREMNESMWEENPPEAWHSTIEWNNLVIDGVSGLDVDLDSEMDVVARVIAADSQFEYYKADFKADVMYRHGRFEEAVEYALQTTGSTPYPYGLEAGILSAVALDDPDRLAAVLDRFDEVRVGRTGSATQTTEAHGRAALEAMTGDKVEAAVMFQHVIDKAHLYLSALQVAAIQASFSALLGDDTPDAAGAGRAALRHIERSGAHLYRRLWVRGLPSDERADRQAAG